MNLFPHEVSLWLFPLQGQELAAGLTASRRRWRGVNLDECDILNGLPELTKTEVSEQLLGMFDTVGCGVEGYPGPDDAVQATLLESICASRRKPFGTATFYGSSWFLLVDFDKSPCVARLMFTDWVDPDDDDPNKPRRRNTKRSTTAKFQSVHRAQKDRDPGQPPSAHLIDAMDSWFGEFEVWAAQLGEMKETAMNIRREVFLSFSNADAADRAVVKQFIDSWLRAERVRMPVIPVMHERAQAAAVIRGGLALPMVMLVIEERAQPLATGQLWLDGFCSLSDASIGTGQMTSDPIKMGVLANKGGVGKSTMLIHLLMWSHASGLNTAMIDLDPTDRAERWHGSFVEKRSETVSHAMPEEFISTWRKNAVAWNDLGDCALKSGDLIGGQKHPGPLPALSWLNTAIGAYKMYKMYKLYQSEAAARAAEAEIARSLREIQGHLAQLVRSTAPFNARRRSDVVDWSGGSGESNWVLDEAGQVASEECVANWSGGAGLCTSIVTSSTGGEHLHDEQVTSGRRYSVQAVVSAMLDQYREPASTSRDLKQGEKGGGGLGRLHGAELIDA